jgi:hypothetical protein
MKPDPLLDAVFGPEEDILRPVLKAARHRRVRRVIIRTAGIAACIAAAAWLAMPGTVSRLRGAGATASPAPRVHGVPAPPQATSHQLATSNHQPAAFETVATRPLTESDIVQTNPASVLVISTTTTHFLPTTLADSDLLAFFAPGRAALVGTGPERRLVEY